MAFDFNKFKTGFQAIFTLDIAEHQKVRDQYGLVLLIVALFLVYINCGYQAQKQQRHVADLNRQVEEAHFEYLTISAQLVEMTRQSVVARKLQENGSPVQPSNKPAILVE